ncbi:hypothetical protein PVAND_012962 [Polypedilum vanderplanki]|uniref:alkaline phosphatase n=1 Tax=Polypedilum vanderplanki TaxID=319348 RepID=A0A9J6CP14_POLVA|nr:hypothetical protein PVAND_012962 [Polypedilum vanderplanki]
MFMGDGMSHSTLAATRIALGGEDVKLAFENFPHTASSKTYCTDQAVADSACTITAMLHGIKTNGGIVGLNGAAANDSCEDQNIKNNQIESIAKWFQDQDRSVGVVTNTKITHATPSGVYANIANRNWEGNAEVIRSGCDHLMVDDIAEQLVHGNIGSKLKVALGGGSKYFINTSMIEHGSNGARTDDDVLRISDLDMHPHLDTTRFKPNSAELSKDFWFNNAKKFVENQVKRNLNTNTAKNVIMFMGDGMSHSTLASTEQFEDEFSRISDLNMQPHFDVETTANKMTSRAFTNNIELTKDFWIDSAKDFVAKQVKKNLNTKKAKNIIMFLGDGMGHSTLAATRIALGGEEVKLAFENFPHTASSKTYCTDQSVADSACTITAMLHGIKTNGGIVGLNAAATRNSCEDQNIKNNQIESIAKWFQDQDRSVGVVTNTKITHATPSGVYANIANRNWEGNAEVIRSGCDHLMVDDIAEQLVHGNIGSKLKVALGGGSKYFINTTMIENGSNGARTDGKNLINEWLTAKTNRQFVRNREELMNVDIRKIDQLLGLFSTHHMPYQLEVNENNEQNIYPTLTEMTLKAIEMLSKNDDGYFLLVEGGRIDNAQHATKARLVIGEMIEFNNAIEAALKKIDLEETLVVVTADHGHALSLAGYSTRNDGVFAMGGIANDELPFLKLSFSNGMGFIKHHINGIRVNASAIDTSSIHFQYPSTFPFKYATHTGEDVGVWAIGPYSHLFSGTIEQNVIAHIMAYASCVGKGLKVCNNND